MCMWSTFLILCIWMYMYMPTYLTDMDLSQKSNPRFARGQESVCWKVNEVWYFSSRLLTYPHGDITTVTCTCTSGMLRSDPTGYGWSVTCSAYMHISTCLLYSQPSDHMSLSCDCLNLRHSPESGATLPVFAVSLSLFLEQRHPAWPYYILLDHWH